VLCKSVVNPMLKQRCKQLKGIYVWQMVRLKKEKKEKKEHTKQVSIKVYLIFMTIIKDVQSIANFSFT
jgi:hypothetical protein